MNESKSNIRALVRGAYDLQKLRIQMGNRIVRNYKAKLGLETQDVEEENADASRILKQLRASYDRLADAVTSRTGPANFKGDGQISQYTEFALMRQYAALMEAETDHFNDIRKTLAGFPIYTEFLADIKGIGPAMAGVIVSEIDIHKAKYPSSLWAYAGLDVATSWKLHDTTWRARNVGKPVPDWVVPETAAHVADENNRPTVDGFTSCIYDDSGKLAVLKGERDGYVFEAVYMVVETGGRSRRAEHLVQRAYTAADGTEKERASITFNPFLKTKLMGVLSASFLRAGENKYSTAYRDYKFRLENNPAHAEKSKGHRHNMALRYAVKMFLIDLHAKWRELEGLPVTVPYHEAKLGLHHGRDAA